MRYIKQLVMAILLLLGFALQCETFRNELYNFNTGYYFSSTISFENEQERIEILQEMQAYAKEKDVHLFATSFQAISHLREEMSLFSDDFVRDYVKQKHGIKEQVYPSVLSGTVEVFQKEFDQLQEYENRYVRTISYYGEEAAIYEVYRKVKSHHDISAPAVQGANEKDLIYVTWLALAAVLVLMTGIEIIYHKKETVVQITMGQDVWKMIVKVIVREVILDIVVFCMIRHAVFYFVSGEFMKKEIFYMYLGGVVISCFCYLSYAKYDIKKAFSNVNDARAILCLNYILKIAVTALAIFLLATNYNTIRSGQLMIREKNIVTRYHDYSFVAIADLTGEEREDECREIQEQIFRQYYETAKPVICGNVLEDDDRQITYICVNENASDILAPFLENLDYPEDAEVIFFVPDKFYDEETYQDAKECLGYLVNNPDELAIEMVEYGGNQYVTYIDNVAVYSMQTVCNPVIVYLLYDGISHIDQLCLEIDQDDVIYRFSQQDIADIDNQYELEKNGYKIWKSSVAENYEYHRNLVRRLIGFCSSLCIFVLILQLFLIVSINKMEYRLNAMELALKKVLGYSIWTKNSRILYTSTGVNLLLAMVLAIIGRWTGWFTVGSCMIASAGVTSMELMVILINIVQTEKKSIPKILKGGCL